MSSKRETFEFYILRDKNWNVQNLYNTEAEAKGAAQQAVKTGQVEGVKIIRLWQRADGEQTEKVVYEQLCDVKKVRDIRISPIEEAHYCETEADLLSPEGMRTCGRLFRKYLDEVQITPMEIMHIHREYKRLWDAENILVSGVDRVALIQTQNTEKDNKERTDELYRIVEAVGQRASRFATDKFVPKRIEGSMADLIKTASEEYYEQEDRMFFTKVVLSRDLREQSSLMGKLERIGELLENETDPEAISYLDAAAAQCLASPQVFQDVLGVKPNLAKALLSLTDILEGGKETFDRAMPRGDLYLKFIQGGMLPQVRKELFERLVSMVGGSGPMSRNEPSNETVEFGLVANRLINEKRVMGNGAVATALAQRACLFVVEGGSVGRKKALEWVLRVLKTVPQRLTFLKCLDHAYRNEPDMRLASFGYLRSLISGVRSAVTFAPQSKNGKRDLIAPMRSATELYKWLESEYPPEPIAPLLDHLDKLVAKYIEEREIIEKVDRDDLKMSERATMLLTFIMSGVLTPGTAMEMARSRVQEHLKRPDFIMEFIQGFDDPKEQEQKLREFHGLLAKAGFSLAG